MWIEFVVYKVKMAKHVVNASGKANGAAAMACSVLHTAATIIQVQPSSCHSSDFHGRKKDMIHLQLLSAGLPPLI